MKAVTSRRRRPAIRVEADPPDARYPLAEHRRRPGVGLRREIRRDTSGRRSRARQGEDLVADAPGPHRRVSPRRRRDRSPRRWRSHDRRRARRLGRERNLALSAAAAPGYRGRVTDALCDLRSPRGRRSRAHVSSTERAPLGSRTARRTPDHSSLPVATARARRKGRVPRSEAARMGRDHRERRGLSVPARGAVALLAQGQGAQGVGVRDRRGLSATRAAPPTPRASRSPPPPKKTPPFRQGGPPPLAGNTRNAPGPPPAVAPPQT